MAKKKRKNRVNSKENIKRAKVIKSYKANLSLLECRINEQEKVAKKAKISRICVLLNML